MDNEPSHQRALMEMGNKIKVVFMPANTISVQQPTDQGIILNSKTYNLRNTFHKTVRIRGQQRMRLLDAIINSTNMSLSKQWDSEGRGSLVCYSPLGRKELDMTEWLNNNIAAVDSDSSDVSGQIQVKTFWKGVTILEDLKNMHNSREGVKIKTFP